MWGGVWPDSQVEDCSSGLPVSVPSPTAPSLTASLPGPVLGVTSGWSGIRAGARAVKRVSGQRLMACQLAASTSSNSLSLQSRDYAGGLRVGHCRRGGVSSGRKWDISIACSLCSRLVLRLGLCCVYVCVHACVCVCALVCLCLRKSGPRTLFGGQTDRSSNSGSAPRLLRNLRQLSFPFAVPYVKLSWLEHLALKFWKPWGSLNEGSSRAGSHNWGGESPDPTGPVSRAKAPLSSLGILADCRAMGLR